MIYPHKYLRYEVKLKIKKIYKKREEYIMQYAVPVTKNKITAWQIEGDTVNLIVRPLNFSSRIYP